MIQEPTIDSLSDGGIKPVISNNDNISFKDVYFSYPSRDNINVI